MESQAHELIKLRCIHETLVLVFSMHQAQVAVIFQFIFQGIIGGFLHQACFKLLGMTRSQFAELVGLADQVAGPGG